MEKEIEIFADYLLNSEASKLSKMIALCKTMYMTSDTNPNFKNKIKELDIFDKQEVESIDLLGNVSYYNIYK